jgi:hypothetical protein
MGSCHRDMLAEALERVAAGERSQAGHGPVPASIVKLAAVWFSHESVVSTGTV